MFRDWSISEARIVLTANLQNNRDPLPPLPNCFDTRGGKNPYLTIEDENRLRQFLAQKYDYQDFLAFMTLQEAAMEGKVKQESREVAYSRLNPLGQLGSRQAMPVAS